MNTPLDPQTVDLRAQAKDIMQEVAGFLAADHSGMPEEEYQQLQRQMMAKQSMAMAALLQSMGYEEKRDTLLQSKDSEVEDIKRRAGLTEMQSKDSSRDFMIMKQIVQLATRFMQDERSDPEIAARMIVSYASKLGKD